MDSSNQYEPWQLELINDPRSTAELINLALAAADDDELWDIVPILHYRPTREVLEATQGLCRSVCPQERELGAHLLAQLGVPERAFPRECVTTLLGMLRGNDESRVLSAALSALGHNMDERIVPAAVRFKTHMDPDVRYAVVQAVTGYDDPLAIATLIELARDADAEVRDWATFGIGQQSSLDTPKIRAALWDRVADEDNDVRGEALRGLASRGDRRVLVPLLAELRSLDVSYLAVEAAELIADPSLYPALVELESWWDENPYQLREALDRCRLA